MPFATCSYSTDSRSTRGMCDQNARKHRASQSEGMREHTTQQTPLEATIQLSKCQKWKHEPFIIGVIIGEQKRHQSNGPNETQKEVRDNSVIVKRFVWIQQLFTKNCAGFPIKQTLYTCTTKAQATSKSKSTSTSSVMKWYAFFLACRGSEQEKRSAYPIHDTVPKEGVQRTCTTANQPHHSAQRPLLFMRKPGMERASDNHRVCSRILQTTATKAKVSSQKRMQAHRLCSVP